MVTETATAIALTTTTVATLAPTPAPTSNGFIEELCKGSFWAGTLVQVLLTAIAIGVAYHLYKVERRNQKDDEKEIEVAKLSMFMDLLFIIRNEIMDEKLGAHKGVIATNPDFLKRDILDDMMGIWMLVSNDTQKNLIQARRQMFLSKGNRNYGTTQGLSAAMEEIDGYLKDVTTELQKDLSARGKIVII